MHNRKVHYNANKLHKRLRRLVGKAIVDFNMIEEGDLVMVCLSGGKDSYVLLDILLNLQLHAPLHFELIAVNLDQKQPGFPADVLPGYLTQIGVPFRIVEQDTYSVVKRVIPEGKQPVVFVQDCAAGFYIVSPENWVRPKLHLGIIEMIFWKHFLNMFYGGKLKAMPPKLISDDGNHIVIRPLAYCKEKDLAAYAHSADFPIIPCNLCGSQPNLQRQIIKEMLQQWDRRFPGRLETMFRAMQNVQLSHLADPGRFDFKGLKTQGGPVADGDIAFDEEIFEPSVDEMISPLLAKSDQNI